MSVNIGNYPLTNLQAYIDEYSWRYNNRKYQDKMFEILVSEVANVKTIG